MVIFKNKRLNGSFTVEASLVLPIFIFFIITIMSLLIMIKKQTVCYSDLHQEALIKYEQSMNSGDNFIDIKKTYVQSPVINIFPVSFSVADGIFMHGFTGYSGDFDGEYSYKHEDDELVYVTESGTKYHTTLECSYLNIRPYAVSAQALKNLRNNSGGKYYACGSCHPKRSGTIYITNYGENYHSSPTCSGLKRTIRAISKKEAVASGYTGCSKCA